ncbi:inner-membrane translocator [Methylobacterium sp. 4-46]|uniref:ABC transporter permease n=1 Tax=unclassified Methylobacterium TaxID=2615210 RepID=UPI000165C595|nr:MULTISPECIES: ABC transporter permease [Methylobacterium]ACA16442.1 inner-membrane translocator [Methylobacterium sp. 4-46]WFT82153.1 ABC transporter permease [Methylobacterium nodulans]
MDPSFLVLQALSGLASAASLFVIASGLTLVFGVTRIVNFAHGSFTMLGAYLAVSLVPRLLDLSYTPASFFLGVLLAALLVGLIGVAVEVLLLRRLYRVPELFQLLATFGVVLIVEDLVLAIWGPVDLAGPRAPSLRHGVEILGQRFPAYDLVLIGIGPALLGLLWLLMHRTRFGILIRAATQDRDMVGALGVNQARLFTLTLFLGAALAGLGGALQIPRVPANGHMDLAVITDAFVVTVIGGMGSVPGAFLAALLIGELQAFGILLLPKATLVLVFALMAVVLVVKPWGLLGRPEIAASGRLPEGILHLRPFRPAEAALTGLAVAALLAVPLVGDAYLVKVATEILVFALAAFSLQFLVGVGGLVSFGHAAYFGLGAYAAGLLVTGPLRAPMELALLAAPLAGALGAALFGFFIVRLSGIYLAMLTLAFAQIVYAIGFQWVEVTGGDNGLVGVWPSAWAAGRTTYFYLVAAATLACIAALRRIVFAPFGYGLRAARDSATRAEAIGLDTRTHRWLAFTLAGGAAGLAGGLYAFQKGSIDPTLAAIPTSIDFLVMVLVGGIRTLMGPLVGAGFFHALKDAVMPLAAYWRLLLGLAIIATVLALPHGLAGAADLLRRRRRPVPAEARA